MAEDKNKYVLSINGMSKSFGRNKVLNHINLNVRPGTIMGLMGENGAGKSTMMKCLFGTYQKDEGTIILDGKEVTLPVYNFITGKSELSDESIKLGEKEILIVEGLHALNEELTYSIDKKNKYKIYLCPLTVLSLDNHNRIRTTDNRLLRRIVRDNRTRGYSASDTLSSWGKVREGEEKYVFPFQDEADVIFNTSLIYELGVLKTYAEPLLYSVEESDPMYKEAVRLLNLLKNILPISNDYIPVDSIVREFIGGGYFKL